MIRLRKLQEKDIEGMLEWMHNPRINCFFRFDAANMNYEKALEFVSKESTENRHFAIVDEQDEYIGTISLKEIDFQHRKAEYAISMREKWHGTGVAKEATEMLLSYAFEELNLHRIYLNVLSDNIRAIKFYEKCGFHFEGEFKDDLLLRDEWKSLKWYAIVNDKKA